MKAEKHANPSTFVKPPKQLLIKLNFTGKPAAFPSEMDAIRYLIQAGLVCARVLTHVGDTIIYLWSIDCVINSAGTVCVHLSDY